MKENITNKFYTPPRVIFQTTMKIFILLFCTSVLALTPGKSVSQKSRVSFEKDMRLSIDDVLKIVKNQTDYNFVYPADMFAGMQNIELSKGDILLENLLRKVLETSAIDFEVAGGNTIVFSNNKNLDLVQKQIQGVVKDESGMPLPGVTVLIEGASNGTSTDFDGNYKINADVGDILVFSYMGFETQKTTVVNTSSVINITLTANVESLDDVIITGFQNIKEQVFTGASQTLKAEDVAIAGVPQVSRLLEGRAAGVTVQNVSGTFGATPKITIRGSSSILGDTKPLWIIDGAIQENIVNVNVNDLASGDANTLLGSAVAGISAADIESIEILKDASASALYGARALNGVIVITTKSGKRNQKTRVNYSVENAVRVVPNYGQFDLLNSQRTIGVYEELSDKGRLNYPSSLQGRYGGVYHILARNINTYNETSGAFGVSNTPEARNRFLQQYELANTDWFKTLFRPSLTQTHSLSFTGGGENSTSYSSISYYTDPGWTVADRVRRLTGNMRNRFFLANDKLIVGTNIQASYRDQNAPGTFNRQNDPVNGTFTRDFDINPFSYALNTSRAIRPYDSNGDLEYVRFNWAPFNIINELEKNTLKINVYDIRLQADLEYKLTDDLKYNFLGTVRYANSTRNHKVREGSNGAEAYRSAETSIVRNQNIFLYSDPSRPNEDPKVVMPYGGILERTDNSITTYTVRNSLNFDKTINDLHTIGLYAAQEYRYNDRYEHRNRNYGVQFGKGNVPFLDPDLFDKLIGEGVDYYSVLETRQREVTFLAKLSYDYDSKYIFNISGNYEGSNRAGRSNSSRWLPTYNVSARWNAGQEDFIKKSGWVSKLSFRAGYGLIALLADNVSNNLPVFRNALTNRLFSDDRENYITIEDLQNSDLTWEQTRELNIGMNAGFLNNRISLDLDLYTRRGADLIDFVRTSGIGGEFLKLGNNSELLTKGIEVQLTTHNIKTDDFSWDTTLNASYFDQEISKIAQRPNVLDLVDDTGGNVVGKPVNGLWSFDFAGLSDQGFPTFNLGDGEDPLRDIDFQDIEDITDYLVYEGPTQANFTGGLSNSFKYKNIDFSFFVTFAQGNKIRLAPTFSAVYNDLSVFSRDFNDRWLISGDENVTSVPTIPSGAQLSAYGQNTLTRAYNAYNYSTERVADGSFIRMRNISLGYSFTSNVLSRLNLSQLRVSAQATNPFLIYSDSKLNGQDPEFIRSGGVAQPVPKQYTVSLNLAF